MEQLSLFTSLTEQRSPPPPLLVAQLKAIEAAISVFNLALAAANETSIRIWGLQVRYYLGGQGGIGVGSGLAPVVKPNEEHLRHRIYAVDVDRAHYRSVLRRAGAAEPMIWERWPALNAEEKEEAKALLSKWNKVTSPQPSADPFQVFLKAEANKKSRASGRPLELLLADGDFIEQVRGDWDFLNLILE